MNKIVRTSQKRGKAGRTPKRDKADNCVMVRFTSVEYADFLALYEQSGLRSKAQFIVARVFNEEFRVIKTDRATLEYVTKLTTFYSQFRAIGVNYNQVVKELHSNFSEKKALALLYKLENATKELIEIASKILQLTQELDAKYLNK